MTDPLIPLHRFQETGETECLAEYLRLVGRDAVRDATTLRILNPVFDALRHGEHPRLGDLDRRDLLEYEAEVRFIAGCMAGSDKADLNGAATMLQDLLDRNDR